MYSIEINIFIEYLYHFISVKKMLEFYMFTSECRSMSLLLQTHVKIRRSKTW